MSTSPLPSLARRARAVRFAPRGLKLALGVAGASGLLLWSPGVHADDEALAPVPAAAAESADPDAVGDKLSEIFARLDQGIRSLTAATDRAAGRALEIGVGALANGHDRRMTDEARTALAGSPAAAQRHFELASVDAAPPSVAHAEIPPAAEGPDRAGASAESAAPPAARSRQTP